TVETLTDRSATAKTYDAAVCEHGRSVRSAIRQSSRDRGPTREGTAMPESTTEPRPQRRWRSQRRRPWRRRTALALVIVAALAATAAITLRTPSPVGHWDSAEGLDRYLAAYDEAFAQLPPPDATLDVRTEYGTVRVYRFAA